MSVQLVFPGQRPSAKPELSQWWTPPALAGRVALFADITPGASVLEPSAGTGTLAFAARAVGAVVHCIEIDPGLAPGLTDLGLSVETADFLSVEPRHFDQVVMNPPFEEGATEAHVEHALRFAPRVTVIAQLSFLAGVDRRSRLWAKHTLTKLAILSRRPRFSGAASTAERDFCVVEILRGPIVGLPLVRTEWWG